jgi:hypothetical protein
VDLSRFPTYGAGPLIRIGVETTVPLLVAYLVVCITEVVVGWLLWSQPSAGALLGLVLLPLELAFWIGFTLPYTLLLGIGRTVLIVVALSRLGRAEI